MQTVGELDHHHPDVVPGGDQHLAEGLGLGGGPEVDLLQLRHPVDQVGHFGTEVGAHLIERHLGVLHRVVQDRGDQRGRPGAELGQDHGDGERVGDERLAALAGLAPVARLGRPVGAAEQGEIRLGVVQAVRLHDRLDGVRQRLAPGGEQGRPAGTAQGGAPEPPERAARGGRPGDGGLRWRGPGR